MILSRYLYHHIIVVTSRYRFLVTVTYRDIPSINVTLPSETVLGRLKPIFNRFYMFLTVMDGERRWGMVVSRWWAEGNASLNVFDRFVDPGSSETVMESSRKRSRTLYGRKRSCCTWSTVPNVWKITLKKVRYAKQTAYGTILKW
jgi:hypothetical protein